ncbi:MAG: peptide ABC transporter substrate-binding protein [Acidobacteriota bacterium]
MRQLPTLVALTALVIGAACAPVPQDTSSAVSERPDRGNRFVVGLQQEPDKLNTMLNAMVTGTYINQTIYGYFAKFDEAMELIPELITEIPTLANGGISADGLTYTYKLRPGVLWHDGQPFTSADVTFTAEVVLNTNHEIETRLPYDRIDRMETPDEHTVVFHLKEPYAPFVTELLVTSHLLPRHLLEEHVGLGFGNLPFHRAPVGLGPFKFKEWNSGSSITVVRNDDYWRGKPGLDEITFRFIPDSNTLFLELQAGGIDLLDNADTDKNDQLEAMNGIAVYRTPALQWEHLDINNEDAILEDVRVRQAVQLAIDREEIAREVYRGIWSPAHGDVHPDLPWYNPEVEKHVRFDPEAAKALLDEAGWTPGRDGIREKDGQRLKISISTTSGRNLRILTEEVLQHHMRRVGIELEIQNHQSTVFFAPYESNGVLKRGKYQLGMYAWITSPDPNRHSLYHSSQVPPPSGQNSPRYRSARMDELLDAGLREVDPAKRKAIYDEVQVLLATELPMTPLVWRTEVDATDSRLQNFKPNRTQVGDSWNAWEWSLTSPSDA